MSTWEIGGAAALETYAPEASAAYSAVVEVRPLGVHDELLGAPAVRAFADRFGDDARGVEDEQREAFALATGTHRVAVAQMVWIGVVTQRLRSSLDAVFGPSQWESPRRFPVADTWTAIDELVETAALRTAGPLAGPAAEAAGALVEAMARTSEPIPDAVLAGVRRELSAAQAVAVVLGLVGNAHGRIVAALGGDVEVPSPGKPPAAASSRR